MLRIRPGLMARIRSVTAEEYALLVAHADERAGLRPEERTAYEMPDAADDSMVGAVLWATFVLWQDHPLFLAFGVIGACANAVENIIQLVK